jgi:tRNA nucleotidyltransferase/poly(A) polymerase
LRDRLLGKASSDIDIAVETEVQAFATRLNVRLKGALQFYGEFGTARMDLPDGRHLDIARTRTETYPRPAMLPRVSPADIRADLKRRDFTINAMAWDLVHERLIDPLGGRTDLSRKVIRVLHERSFSDDPTRIFRAVRFSRRLGFRIEPATSRRMNQAIAQGLLGLLSGKRLLTELRLIVHEPNYVGMLRELNRRRVFASSLGTSLSPPVFRELGRLRELTPELRLTYLLSRLPMRDRLPLTREEQADLESLVRFPAGKLARARTPSRVYALLHALSSNALLIRATLSPKPIARRVRAYLNHYTQIAPLLRGKDLLRLLIPPGPVYTRILERLRSARLDGKVMSRDDELALVHRMLRRDPGRKADISNIKWSISNIKSADERRSE